jgi:transposase
MAAVDNGMSKSEAARVFGVGLATIKRYAALRREQGSLTPKPHPGRPPLLSPEQLEVLRTQLLAQPEAYLDEHRDLLAIQIGVRVSPRTMSRLIRQLEFTRKKGRWVPASVTRPGA